METVRFTWGPSGGAGGTVDFPCAVAGGTLGVVEGEGCYSIRASGVDAGGVARAESYGASMCVSQGVPPSVSVDVSLHPKPGNVIVSWSVSGGGGCPSGYIIPYYVNLRDTGGALVKHVQVSCVAAQTTLDNVAPGDYVVEIDSITTVPSIYGSAPVTVVPGEDAQVSFIF